MAVLYSWTEDGLPERCTVLRAEVHDAMCYHCGGPLEGPCVRLDAPTATVTSCTVNAHATGAEGLTGWKSMRRWAISGEVPPRRIQGRRPLGAR